jgi:hypothetical protein
VVPGFVGVGVGVGATELELELELVEGLGFGFLGFGGDLRSGIAAFALTAVTETVWAPWTLVAGAS